MVSPAALLVWTVGLLTVDPPAPPVITSVFPMGVTVGGGIRVEIRGVGFGPSPLIHISGAGVSVSDVRLQGEDGIAARFQADRLASCGFRELRVEGPGGVSNALPIRVDVLEEMSESEPNDTTDTANRIEGERGVSARLTKGDVDHYRVEGHRGQRLTIEVEARRLGVPIVPVVTVISMRGTPLRQARETRGVDRDCRFAFTPEADGPFLVQVRDHLYNGGEQAGYRLRVTPRPFATAIDPLGGRADSTLIVSLLGGTARQTRREIRLPDEPGAFVNPGPFGDLLAPGRLAVGDGPEAVEPDAIEPGVTANGRLGRDGEVDRYRVRVRAGEPVRVGVIASPLGSWLDSVVTLRDGTGRVVAENDDHGRGRDRTSDSRIDFLPETDATLSIEVADRYGAGGPEYGYRLTAGPPVAGFSLAVKLDGPRPPMAPADPSPVIADAFTVPRGGTVALEVTVRLDGSPGPIRLRMEGLPRGVTADPVEVRPSSEGPPEMRARLTIRAGAEAAPGSSTFRVIGVAEPEEGRPVRVTASTIIPHGLNLMETPVPPVARPVNRYWLTVVSP